MMTNKKNKFKKKIAVMLYLKYNVGVEEESKLGPKHFILTLLFRGRQTLLNLSLGCFFKCKNENITCKLCKIKKSQNTLKECKEYNTRKKIQNLKPAD